MAIRTGTVRRVWFAIRTAMGIFLAIVGEIFVFFDFYNLTLINQQPWAVFSFLKSIFQSSTYHIDVTLVKFSCFCFHTRGRHAFNDSRGKGNIVDNQEQSTMLPPKHCCMPFQQLLIFGCVK